MSEQIYHGPNIVEQPIRATRKKGSAGSTVRRFTGKEAEITAAAQALLNTGWETEIEGGAVWKLTATKNIDIITNPDESEPEPPPVWELLPHIYERNIFDLDRAFVTGLPSKVRTAIENKLKNPDKFNFNFLQKNLAMSSTEYFNLNNRAARIYTYKQMGVNGRQDHILSLRRSIIVSTDFETLTWTTTNANTILSTATLLSNVSANPPPDSMVQVINAQRSETVNEILQVEGYFSTFLVDGAGSMPVPIMYGWLEQFPTFQTVGADRMQISQVWTHGKYLIGPEGIYDIGV